MTAGSQRMRIAKAVGFTGLTAGLAAMATLVLAGLGSRLVFAARVLPGVQAAGIDLGGLSRPEVESALTQTLTYPQTGTILLRDQSSHWIATPSDLGVAIDVAQMTEQVLAAGRGGGLVRNLSDQITAWGQGIQLAPVVTFDQRVAVDYLDALAAQIDRPTIEAGLSLNGLEVEARPGQVGRTLDVVATLDILHAAFEELHDAQLELVVDEQPPRVLDVSEQAARAGRILSRPLSLTAEGSSPWVIEPSIPLGMTTILSGLTSKKVSRSLLEESETVSTSSALSRALRIMNRA